jgi:hypothetical protein
MNHALRCSHCRALFVPNPRVKAQRFCAQKPCQRARKTQWQRDKLARDPDYRANQRDCQRHWQRHHPHYWRQYRHKRADYCERNRLRQRQRDHKRRLGPLAKMDALAPLTILPSGIYHLIPEVGGHLAKMDASSPKYHVIPVT